MVEELQWLTLEVKYLDRAQSFYESFLDLESAIERERETVLDAGETDLVLRAPGDVPRGGLHTHFAFSLPHEEYDTWYDRLDERFDLVEHTFGDARSLYFYDTEGNCVEIGQFDVAGPGIDGIFEVVFEVENLSISRKFYESLGFETVDVGDERARIRMTTGEFDIELWEPQLGLADGRGGVHVDAGITAANPAALVDNIRERALATQKLESGYRVRDPDGHYITLLES